MNLRKGYHLGLLMKSLPGVWQSLGGGAFGIVLLTKETHELARVTRQLLEWEFSYFGYLWDGSDDISLAWHTRSPCLVTYSLFRHHFELAALMITNCYDHTGIYQDCFLSHYMCLWSFPCLVSYTGMCSHMSLSSWYLLKNQLLQEDFPGPQAQISASSVPWQFPHSPPFQHLSHCQCVYLRFSRLGTSSDSLQCPQCPAQGLPCLLRWVLMNPTVHSPSTTSSMLIPVSCIHLSVHSVNIHQAPTLLAGTGAQMNDVVPAWGAPWTSTMHGNTCCGRGKHRGGGKAIPKLSPKE